MLIPAQTSGSKPPLYVVHGLSGLMPLGRFLAQSLGPDQPLYCIHANGADGREVICGNVRSVKGMVRTYVDDILRVQPRGPLIIGGMCIGGLIAIEIARELQIRGRDVGPVILADPPTVPPGYIKQNQKIDPNSPRIASQLYERVRGQLLEFASDPYNDLPFEAGDEQQVHFATLAGVNAMIAQSVHRPELYPGSAIMILSIAHAPGIFHPQMHWVKLLPKAPMSYVLPCGHKELFRAARHDFARVLKFALDHDVNSRIEAERALGPAFASA